MDRCHALVSECLVTSLRVLSSGTVPTLSSVSYLTLKDEIGTASCTIAVKVKESTWCQGTGDWYSQSRATSIFMLLTLGLALAHWGTPFP